MFLSVFIPYVENALPAQMAKWEWCYWYYLCLYVFYAVMCIMLLSAGVVWK
jgi:hypothetical protein